MPPDADQRGTDVLLKVLGDYGVKVTFGIVGQVALDGGEPPERCPDQIRAVYEAGHEIASHSMSHCFLPPLKDAELYADLSTSKQVLEACIGAEVRGFIPPFNRPMHFPSRGAFSIAEVLGLHGRGRGRQSIGTMLHALRVAGFGWSRVSFENKVHQVLKLLGVRHQGSILQPFLWHGLVAIPLHATGFGAEARSLLRRFIHMEGDRVVTLYAHPNQAIADNEQSARELAGILNTFGKERSRGEIQFNTMGEIEVLWRNRYLSSRS